MAEPKKKGKYRGKQRSYLEDLQRWLYQILQPRYEFPEWGYEPTGRAPLAGPTGRAELFNPPTGRAMLAPPVGAYNLPEGWHPPMALPVEGYTPPTTPVQNIKQPGTETLTEEGPQSLYNYWNTTDPGALARMAYESGWGAESVYNPETGSYVLMPQGNRPTFNRWGQPMYTGIPVLGPYEMMRNVGPESWRYRAAAETAKLQKPPPITKTKAPPYGPR